MGRVVLFVSASIIFLSIIGIVQVAADTTVIDSDFSGEELDPGIQASPQAAEFPSVVDPNFFCRRTCDRPYSSNPNDFCR